jgi:hypothetical protein
LHVLQWLQENGYKFDHRAYTQAAACSGSLEFTLILNLDIESASVFYI